MKLLCGMLAAALTALGASTVPLDVPLFKQEKDGCGAASAAMVMHYWFTVPPHHAASVPTPQEVYDHLYNADRGGVLLSDIKRYLDNSGFEAFTFRGQWTDVSKHIEKGRPLIVGLKKKPKADIHFVVVIGSSADAVWLNDPTRKQPVRLTQTEFLQRWALADSWLLLATPRVSP